MDIIPTVEEHYLKQEVCGTRTSTFGVNEPSNNYPQFNENINPSFVKLQVKDEHTAMLKLENVRERGDIKREADDFDVNLSETIAIRNEADIEAKLKPLIQEEVDIKEESELQNKKIDPKEKPFACDVCACKFSHKYELHMRTHTEKKPFACNVCNYKCSQKGNLHRHMRTHTGEKPFVCNMCDYKCSQKFSLRGHMRTHTGEKPFTCNVCHYKCSQKGRLRDHMRTYIAEQPFACNVCDYKCSRKGSLRDHMRTHTVEKPFVCNVCDFKCSHKSNLHRHMRTHTGKKGIQGVN